MIILIPMGGKGSRFTKAGYKINKASILTTDRHSGKKVPMVVCAMKDIPGTSNENNKIICINRDFHKTNGTEAAILKEFPNAIFIHDHVLLDQAFGCFLAREFLQTNEDLFIGACDNGMEIDTKVFNELKEISDVIMISHTNDTNIKENPCAHSWAILDEDSKFLKGISLKKTVSNNPMIDHATTGMFWFKNAKVFLKYLTEMIWNKDTLDNKYYVDKILQYYIKNKLKVTYLDVKYICWGTPKDYEIYEQTIKYWENFVNKEDWIK